MDLVNVPAKFEVRMASSVPEIIAIGRGCEPQSWEEEAVGVGGGTVRKSKGEIR